MQGEAVKGLSMKGKLLEPGFAKGSFGCLGWLARLSGSSGDGHPCLGVLSPPSTRALKDSKATPSHCSHNRSGQSKSGVCDKYRVSKAVLGKGKYGTVHPATVWKTGQKFALKTVNKAGPSSRGPGVAWKEILIQRACCHPQLVQIHESFESEMHLHIVMEMCTGGDVQDLLQRGPISEAGARLVMKQVLAAVSHLHTVKHVAHRDVKPRNLLLQLRDVPLADNCVKLTDFGLAESFTPGERTFHVACGTPAYMAPEILLGAYDENCDLWRCGVTLHELLSGRLPFEGTSMREILATAASSPFCLDDSNWPQVSPSAKALLRSMCEVDVSTRLSADQALQRVLR